MSAPKGNKYWTARSNHGRKPKFSTSDKLWTACTNYFEWVENNPLHKTELFTYQGKIIQEPVAKMRAMTLSGLCLFLDIDKNTWASYKDREGFLPITTRAEDIIYTQKFTGAAAGLLNTNIIARDLGLRASHRNNPA